jgi:hypothetical protein
VGDAVKKVLFLLAIVNISTWATATTPVVQILSPIAVSSEEIQPWEGSSPMHLVAYATTSDCSAGISGMQVYTGDYQLFYSTFSSYLDIFVPYNDNVENILVKGWDNCGGVTVTGIFPYNNEQTGHVSVISPLPNISYLQYDVQVIASATTTCPQGVSAMGVYTADHVRVATQPGASINTPISVAPGTYNLVVEEWDNCGGAATTPLNLIVTGDPSTGLATPPMFAYMPDPAGGTTNSFWITTGCQLNPVQGTPNPADWDPISASTDLEGYVYVLNQVSMNLTVYQADYVPLLGGLTQIPGSPFSLNLPTGYTPNSVLAINGTAGVTGVYVASSSSSGGGIISEFNFNQTTQTLTPVAGSPLTLKGNVAPTNLVLGPVTNSTGPYWVFANDGSSISVLSGSAGGGALTEASGSPFTVTGLQGEAVQVQDIMSTYGNTNTTEFVYTANSDNSISGFQIGTGGGLTPVTGSPWADPDSPAGTSGNPTSILMDTYANEFFGLDSGSSSLSVWGFNASTGVLSYQSVQQAGLLKSVAGDKLRQIDNIPVDCLVTSNGYGLTVNDNTGQTSLASGSPVLDAEGDYPSVALTFW